MNRESFQSFLEKSFDENNPVTVRVTGYSMGPFLKNLRDSVVLIKAHDGNIKKRSIVLFQRQGGEFVLHRIIKINKDGSLTVNGDSQLWTETIDRKQVSAVAESLIRKGRLVSCGGIAYRAEVWLWCFLKPLRGMFIGLYRLIKKK